jgi:hypothetical protein
MTAGLSSPSFREMEKPWNRHETPRDGVFRGVLGDSLRFGRVVTASVCAAGGGERPFGQDASGLSSGGGAAASAVPVQPDMVGLFLGLYGLFENPWLAEPQKMRHKPIVCQEGFESIKPP